MEVVRRIHNPRNRTCGCDPDCWCNRTALGRAVKWWFPARYFGLQHKAGAQRRFMEARPAGRVVDVLETALYCSDLAAAEDFYGRVLALEFDSKEAGRHVFFRCGRGMLLIFDPAATSHPGPVPSHGATGPGHTAFAVESDDVLAAWPERLAREGIEIEADVEWPGGGRSIYFRDPAGNSLEVTTPRIWGLDERNT